MRDFPDDIAAPFEDMPLETARFGSRSARLSVGLSPAEIAPAVAVAREAGVRLLSARIDIAETASLHALEAVGFRLMDTVVTYAGDLSAAPKLPDARIRPGRADDADVMAAIAHAAFGDYGGRYHADARLETADIRDAYADWARRSAGPDAYLVEDTDGVAGFLTTARDGDTMTGVLSAVAPHAQRRGVYAAVFAGAMADAKAGGLSRMQAATETGNWSVQRVWCRLGLVPVSARHTLHCWLDVEKGSVA